MNNMQVIALTAVFATTLSVVSAVPAAPQDPDQAAASNLQERVTALEADVANVVAVPVGTVLDWWCTATCTSLPEGFAVADGSTVGDPESPFFGQSLPDLTNRFVRGVTSGTPGAIGGNLSHSHTGMTGIAGGHSHTVSTSTASDHTHAVTGTGAHGHVTGAPSTEVSVLGPGLTGAATDFHTHSIAVSGNHSHDAVAAGGHEHSGTAEGVGGHPHNLTTNPTDHLPPFIGLVKIIRIK